jgi:hypothetical protein
MVVRVQNFSQIFCADSKYKKKQFVIGIICQLSFAGRIAITVISLTALMAGALCLSQVFIILLEHQKYYFHF